MPIISGSGGGGLGGVLLSGAAAASKVIGASSASAASWVFPPGFEIAYSQITAPVNVVSTTEATGTTIISPGAITFDGTLVLCEVYFAYILNSSTAGASLSVSLFEGATQIGRIVTLSASSAALQQVVSLGGQLRFTPTAASHTYTVTAFSSSLTGTPACGAGAGGTGAYLPSFIRFTKV